MKNLITKKQIKEQIKKTIESHSIYMLCEMFEITNSKEDSSVPGIRGLIMDELEKRDSETFNSWIDTENINEMDYPSKFFIC